MYKLLLATNDPAVVEAFSAVKWEELGFKQPRVVSTAEEALSSLRVNHADAVAIGLPKEQDDLLVEQLLEKNPMLPIMAVSTKPGVIESYAVELRRLLGRINADVSNDAFSTADLLKECRHEFFRALMDGRATSEEDVLRHLRLIRSKMDPTKPCVVAELEIPADNDFLRGRSTAAIGWKWRCAIFSALRRTGCAFSPASCPATALCCSAARCSSTKARTRTRRSPASCPTISATALSMWTSIWALTCGLHRFACCRA